MIMKGDIIMSKIMKRSLICLGSLAAVGALAMVFFKKRAGENDLFEEDDDFDDVTMPTEPKTDSSRSYINLV